ncbi:hypothetical protein LJC38_01615, partial [Parabacteroides sp. OttesenSCG-928-K15]|nr:hypothetical protein [Parabacteroides sp. OttesenSCG-928-K15]
TPQATVINLIYIFNYFPIESPHANSIAVGFNRRITDALQMALAKGVTCLAKAFPPPVVAG